MNHETGYAFAGALGHPWLKGLTPNLDRMVNRGVNFRNAFPTTSLCSPSRTSMLTGLYMHRHGVRDNFSALEAQLLSETGGDPRLAGVASPDDKFAY